MLPDLSKTIMTSALVLCDEVSLDELTSSDRVYVPSSLSVMVLTATIEKESSENSTVLYRLPRFTSASFKKSTAKSSTLNPAEPAIKPNSYMNSENLAASSSFISFSKTLLSKGDFT